MDNRLPAGLRGRVILGKGNEVTIGDRIRRIRKKRRLTQAELAMMSGLSLSAIQGYEQGRYEPKRKSLESIAEVFKIPVDELYDTPAELGTNLAEVGKDLISRKAAINAIDECYCGGEDSCGEPWVYKENAVEAIQMIEPIPSAQPNRGKWIYCEDSMADSVDGYRCDHCGFFVPWDYTHKSIDYIKSYKYCPYCGADMRGEQE